MNTIVINQDNAISSVQKILKLISSGKRLEVRELNIWDNNPKIQRKLELAKKEYEKGNFIFWWIVENG